MILLSGLVPLVVQKRGGREQILSRTVENAPRRGAGVRAQVPRGGADAARAGRRPGRRTDTRRYRLSVREDTRASRPDRAGAYPDAAARGLPRVGDAGAVDGGHALRAEPGLRRAAAREARRAARLEANRRRLVHLQHDAGPDGAAALRRFGRERDAQRFVRQRDADAARRRAA